MRSRYPVTGAKCVIARRGAVKPSKRILGDKAYDSAELHAPVGLPNEEAATTIAMFANAPY
jgi:hypothetical protein